MEGFSWKRDAVFDLIYQNRMMDGIMDDILLLENQIPLWVVKDILQTQMGSSEAAGKKLDEMADLLLSCLTRDQIFKWYIIPNHSQCSHVLEILYRGLLDSDVLAYEKAEALQMLPSHNSMQIYFKKVVDICGHWYKMCSRSTSNTSLSNVQRTPSLPHNYIQIWIKSGIDSMKTICERWFKMCLALLSSNMSPSEADVEFVKLPTAFDLMRSGVKIQAVIEENVPEKPGSALQWVRFDEKTSTLYLPAMDITLQLYSVMSNIIAMEASTVRYYPRPMTQYVLFMDELMDTEDVAVLRKAEVIQNFLGSNQQVADLFNLLGSGIAPYQCCKVINDARRGLHKYTKRKYKILWKEFVSAYFSKPWLVAGSIAAVLLLWMTIVQVLCLFITCNS